MVVPGAIGMRGGRASRATLGIGARFGMWNKIAQSPVFQLADEHNLDECLRDVSAKHARIYRDAQSEAPAADRCLCAGDLRTGSIRRARADFGCAATGSADFGRDALPVHARKDQPGVPL